jgi:hypothetical protein
MGWATFWAILLTNSSGRPVRNRTPKDPISRRENGDDILPLTLNV